MACKACGYYRGRKVTGSFAETKLAQMKEEKKEAKAEKKAEKKESKDKK